jgi:hypothetical protein
LKFLLDFAYELSSPDDYDFCWSWVTNQPGLIKNINDHLCGYIGISAISNHPVTGSIIVRQRSALIVLLRIAYFVGTDKIDAKMFPWNYFWCLGG